MQAECAEVAATQTSPGKMAGVKSRAGQYRADTIGNSQRETVNGRQAWNLGKRRGGLKVRRSSQRPSVSGSQPLLVLGPMATATRQGIWAKPPRLSVPRPPRIREAFKPKPHLPSLESRVSCTCPQAIPFLCIYACINDMKEGRNRSTLPITSNTLHGTRTVPARALLTMHAHAIITPLSLSAAAWRICPIHAELQPDQRRRYGLQWRYANPPIYVPFSMTTSILQTRYRNRNYLETNRKDVDTTWKERVAASCRPKWIAGSESGTSIYCTACSFRHTSCMTGENACRSDARALHMFHFCHVRQISSPGS